MQTEMQPTGIGHVHFKVRELERSIEFYQTIFGLHTTERLGRYAFLSWGDHHHDIALQAIGEDVPGSKSGVGLYHVAFEVAHADGLQAVYDELSTRNIEVAPVDHGISKALYFDDPDGNGLEVYLDTRETNDRDRWEGRNRSFDPTALDSKSPEPDE